MERPRKVKHIGREISVIENKIASYNRGESALKDALAFVDLIEEADDESLVPENSMLREFLG